MLSIIDYNPISTTPWTFGQKLKNRLWEFVNCTIFRWSPRFMNRFRVSLLNIFGANITPSCSIHPLTVIDMPCLLSMKAYSSIGRNCYISAGPVTIGEKCCIGAYVKLLPSSHNINSPYFEYEARSINIEDGCWIATGATIAPPITGITVGRFSVVGCESLVTKSTMPFSVVGGNPAKVISKRVIKSE